VSIDYTPLKYVEHSCPICNNRVRFPANECERAQYEAKYFREAFNKIAEGAETETRALRAEVEQLRAFRDSVYEAIDAINEPTQAWLKIAVKRGPVYRFGLSEQEVAALNQLIAIATRPTPPPNQA
jgi:hypothetical protein